MSGAKFATGRMLYLTSGSRPVISAAATFDTYSEAERQAKKNFKTRRGGPDVFLVASGDPVHLATVASDNAGVYVAMTWEGGKYA